MHRIPALLFGLGFLVGTALALTSNLLLALPLIPLFSKRRQILLVVVGVLCGAVYAGTVVKMPDKTSGVAHLHIERIAKGRGKMWSYQGHLKSLEGAKNLPIGWTTPVRLEGYCDYRCEGSLLQKGRFFRFQPAKKCVWEPIAGTRSLAERRFGARGKISAYLTRHLSHETAQFLAALATGEIADASLFRDFSRLGLAHLMAISGFHFSLVAALLGFAFRPFFPYKLHALFCLILLSLYFGFIGVTPSVLRAWVMALMGLCALVIERQNTALNALGIALTLVLLVDPYSVFSIGFQFSFLCTGSILLFYRPVSRLLSSIFPRYAWQEVAGMSYVDQHGFLLATLVRKALALGIAVNIGALPLTLFCFHRFPLIGFACNLFVPALITLALFLLPFAALVAWVFPWAGRALFAVEEGIVQATLDFTRYLPAYFDFQWVISTFPLALMVVILMGLACLLRCTFAEATPRKQVPLALERAGR